VPKYLRSALQILDRGLKTNSYKFALLRALADAGERGLASNVIGFEWLAERFVSYYWPLTVTFRVRQATDPTRDPVVMRFIRQEVAALGLSSNTRLQNYTKEHRGRYTELLSKCCRLAGCFDEVIPRFHNLRGGAAVPAILYRCADQQILLEEGAIEFLSAYHRTLQLLALGSWVQFTEQFTFAPRLYEKIAGVSPERKHERYRSFLLQIQGTDCFYCGCHNDKPLHVDHVIPWSFVLEDRVWNLVLACQMCNSAKRDRTPGDSVLGKLSTRNRNMIINPIGRAHRDQASEVANA
jgi:hypothetical protein